MSKSNDIYHYNPRIIIDKHFSEKINQIDINTEQQIANENLSESDLAEINELRNKKITKVTELKQINLDANKFDEEFFYEKWQLLIENNSMEYLKKLDMIKKDLIVYDCVLVNDANFKSNMSLWTFPWFNDMEQVDFVKYRIKIL